MIRLIRHAVELARTAYARHAALSDLERLSDTQLRDLGLDRDMVVEQIRLGMPWPALDAVSAQSFRASVQGCG